MKKTSKIEALLLFTVIVGTGLGILSYSYKNNYKPGRAYSESKIFDLRHDGCMLGIYNFNKIEHNIKTDFNYLMKFCEDTIKELDKQLGK